MIVNLSSQAALMPAPFFKDYAGETAFETEPVMYDSLLLLQDLLLLLLLLL